jgi:D-alanyl-D-alanine carboxypeptidase-like protein
MTARHRRSVIRRRRVVAGLVVLGVAAGGVAVWRARRSPIVIPDDPCTSRPPLRTMAGVTLQPVAMTAFLAAERQAGRTIPVVWSYRSCRQQRIACRNICGDPNGCADRCAPPGESWHQLGAAIDTTQKALADDRIVRALVDNGWCQPLPGTDPGHFSFGGCH